MFLSHLESDKPDANKFEGNNEAVHSPKIDFSSLDSKIKKILLNERSKFPSKRSEFSRSNKKAQNKHSNVAIKKNSTKWKLKPGLVYPAGSIEQAEKNLNQLLLTKADYMGNAPCPINFNAIWLEICDNDSIYPLRLSLRAYGAILESMCYSPCQRINEEFEKLYQRSKKYVIPEGDPSLRNVIFTLCMKGAKRTKNSKFAKKIYIDSKDTRERKNFSPTNDFYCDLIMTCISERNSTSASWAYDMMRKNTQFRGKDYLWPKLMLLLAPSHPMKVVHLLEEMLDSDFFPKIELLNELREIFIKQGSINGFAKIVQATLYLYGKFGDEEKGLLDSLAFSAKVGRMDLFEEIYNGLYNDESKGLFLSENEERVLNYVIIGNLKGHRPQAAIDYILERKKEGKDVHPRTIISVSKALATMSTAIDDIYYYLAEKKISGESVPIEAVNVVLGACSFGGHVDRAFDTSKAYEKLFGLKMDLFAYNCMLRVTAKKPSITAKDDVRAAIGLSLFEKMKDQGVQPNEETYFHLIQLLSLSQAVEELLAVYKEMESSNIVPGEPIIRLSLPILRRYDLKKQVKECEERLREIESAAASNKISTK